jgi:hypothetical protein
MKVGKGRRRRRKKAARNGMVQVMIGKVYCHARESSRYGLAQISYRSVSGTKARRTPEQDSE